MPCFFSKPRHGGSVASHCRKRQCSSRPDRLDAAHQKFAGLGHKCNHQTDTLCLHAKRGGMVR